MKANGLPLGKAFGDPSSWRRIRNLSHVRPRADTSLNAELRAHPEASRILFPVSGLASSALPESTAHLSVPGCARVPSLSLYPALGQLLATPGPRSRGGREGAGKAGSQTEGSVHIYPREGVVNPPWSSEPDRGSQARCPQPQPQPHPAPPRCWLRAAGPVESGAVVPTLHGTHVHLKVYSSYETRHLLFAERDSPAWKGAQGTGTLGNA